MVETGEINDPNYVLDEKGKAHYLFDKKNASGKIEKTFRTHSKHGTGRASGVPSTSRSAASGRSSPSAERASSATKKRKRRARNWDDSDDDDDVDDFEDYNDNSGAYISSLRTTRRTRSRRLAGDEEEGSGEGGEEEEDDGVDPENPLPGFVDPITLDEVVKPAISKYGHVMGYLLSNQESALAHSLSLFFLGMTAGFGVC